MTPSTLTFTAGSTTPTTTPQVYGATLGYTTVTATAPGYTTASLQIHISDGIRINLPPAVTVGLGQSASYTVILDQPAPTGGTTVSLSSTNPSIVSVSATAFVPQGATQPTTQPTVTGLNVGSGQINASASGYTSASPQTVTVNATMSFTPATLSVSSGTTQNATLTLSGPAPASGLTINLASSNTSAATVPNSVTFSAGATTVSVPVTGVASGSASATITASTTAPNIPSTTLSVSATAAVGMIGLPSNTSVVLGQSVTFPVTLPTAAPVGGVTVTLSSANSSIATVTSSVTIAAGATQPATQPQVTGVNLGAVNINASAPGYTSAVQQVQVAATLSFTPNTVTVIGTGTQSLTLALSASAPTGSLAVNLSSSNTGVATVPSSVTIPAGTISVPVTVTGVNPRERDHHG